MIVIVLLCEWINTEGTTVATMHKIIVIYIIGACTLTIYKETSSIFKPDQRPACTCFLEIAHWYVCICVCICPQGK